MSHIKVRKQDGILNVTLNRPDLRNAFHPMMIGSLTEAFQRAHDEDDIIAVLLSGEGKSFCAGADIACMRSMIEFSYEQNVKDSDKLFEMFHVGLNCKKPIVGHIHGHAMGGALGLIAICDFALAEQGTQFGFTEVRLGLVPAVISSFVKQKMDAGWAHRLMIGGEIFTTSEAYDSGLVQFVGTPEEVEEKVEDYLEGIKNASAEAVWETKKLLRYIENQEFDMVRKQSVEVISERRVSDDGQKRLKVFLDKKKS